MRGQTEPDPHFATAAVLLWPAPLLELAFSFRRCLVPGSQTALADGERVIVNKTVCPVSQPLRYAVRKTGCYIRRPHLVDRG